MQDGEEPQGPPLSSAPEPGPDPASDSSGASAADSSRSGLMGFVRAHKVAFGVLALFLVLMASAAGGYAYYLNSLLGEVEHLPETALPDASRPERNETGAVTILLAGADNGQGRGIAASMASGEWPEGEHRSDTIMVLHLPENRKKAYLLSIPRDSYVRIYDDTGQLVRRDKINSAFADYGPDGLVSTVEHLTDIRMDHLAIIDWKGFKDIVDALGGVTVYVPETTEPDPKLDNVVFPKGYNDFDGDLSLKYVRSRSTFALQDIGRIDRQQNFLRAVIQKIDDTGMVTSPRAFSQTFKAIAQNLTVDAEWDDGSLRSFALSVRGLQTEDLRAMSAPLHPTEPFPTIDGVGSAVALDVPALRRLFGAMKEDEAARYVRRHRDLLLPRPDKIE
jgi:LCP family protein required for cell wall assembly